MAKSLRTHWARRLKPVLFRERDDLSMFTFYERGWMTALVPTQERFGLAREMLLQRVYEHESGALDVGLVVDAGANVGLFTLLASRHAKRVVALEPDPINHHVLAINLLANNVTNVEALEAALWTDEGSVSFERPEWEQDHRYIASTGSHVTQAGNGTTAKVHATTLESLVQRFGDIDLLKLDIEGAEHAVVPNNSALSHVRRIVAELHITSPEEETALVLALEKSGFRVRRVDAGSLFTLHWVPTVISNWRRLERQSLIKIGLLVYMLLPFRDKGTGPGRDLPLLIAVRAA